ncbi:YadA-like family protein [Stenotrophomonas sp. HITSZ_GD]|uniref:YadA-like family protein n=1 Tax=Stenotrophomonas sp. HITSZ_GD TaxID=3037248 RepID=UPI00240E1EC6|nr:YadA-like family protein [Stenotrophomonas sp. HITSZ_GD]MDG2525156.1 YadA-like family protein [Stenotrophomonas sp. HITSZ_GD]
MNRIYRIVWNATINRWVVASEVAKGRKKQSAGEARPSGHAAVMFAATLMVAGAAWTPQPAEAFLVKCNLGWGPCPKVTHPTNPAPAPTPAADYDWAASTHKYFRANDNGKPAEPLGSGSVAIGGNSRARDAYTLAAGNNAKGSGYSAVAVGGWSHAAGSSAVAVGNTASAKQEHAIAVGGYSRAEGEDAIALGSHSNALGEGAVSLGSGSSAEVAFGSAFGTGARVLPGADGAVALGAYSVADRDDTVSVGDAKGDKRQVVNVGAGTEGYDAVNVNVADGVRDTDVATVRQMNQAQTSAKEYTDTRINDAWNTITRDMDDMNRQVNRGIAASAALINVTPYLPGRTALNAGVSSYRGEAALGVGLSRWSDNGRVNFNAGISAAKDDEPIYRVGMGIVF